MQATAFNFAPISFRKQQRALRHLVSRKAPARQPVVSCAAHTTIEMKQIRGVSEIASQYDAVLLDQFGVIHDGQNPYPNALKAIEQLHKTGVKVVILSNSSKQSQNAATKLKNMGVSTECIHGIITSGQLALRAMKELMAESPSDRVLHFNWTSNRGSISLDDHNIREIAPLTEYLHGASVPAADTIDFILAHGTDAITNSATSVQETPLNVLRELCQRLAMQNPALPFYCANPDMVTVDGPQLRVMPGTLARDFEDAGGVNVFRFGKPDNIAYKAACALLKGINKARILAIGDSLGHDVLGAANAGIDSLYIAGGINATTFGIDPAQGFRDEAIPWVLDSPSLEALAAEEAPDLTGRKPAYVSPFFRW